MENDQINNEVTALPKYAHTLLVKQLVKPGVEISARMSKSGLYACCALLDLAASLGGLLDSIKKVVIYNKPETKETLVARRVLHKRFMLCSSDPSLSNPILSRLEELSPDKVPEKVPEKDAHNIHMLLGIIGEVGELIDGVLLKTIDTVGDPEGKKMDNIVEELGDLEFYLEGLRQGLGISRESTLLANIKKLNKRYSAGTYTDTDAHLRADKWEEIC